MNSNSWTHFNGSTFSDENSFALQNSIAILIGDVVLLTQIAGCIDPSLRTYIYSKHKKKSLKMKCDELKEFHFFIFVTIHVIFNEIQISSIIIDFFFLMQKMSDDLKSSLKCILRFCIFISRSLFLNVYFAIPSNSMLEDERKKKCDNHVKLIGFGHIWTMFWHSVYLSRASIILQLSIMISLNKHIKSIKILNIYLWLFHLSGVFRCEIVRCRFDIEKIVLDPHQFVCDIDCFRRCPNRLGFCQWKTANNWTKKKNLRW